MDVADDFNTLVVQPIGVHGCGASTPPTAAETPRRERDRTICDAMISALLYDIALVDFNAILINTAGELANRVGINFDHLWGIQERPTLNTVQIPVKPLACLEALAPKLNRSHSFSPFRHH